MTRIRYIEPVDSDLYHESRTAFMNKIASPGTEIEVCNVSLPAELAGPMLPPVLLYLNEIIKEVLKAEEEGCDAAIIGCCSDPALPDAQRVAKILAVGPLQAAAAAANMDRIDAIARWGSVGNTERDRVAKGDLARRLMHESSATGLTETSIPIVAAKMGVPYNAALKARATTIGKTLKELYVKRHRKNPPKRSVAVATNTGSTIVRENCYFEKDEDLIRTAIEKELRR